MGQVLPPTLTGAPLFPMPPLPGEVNERLRELSIGPPNPDPVVETSSLSAVQPPEPTYNLSIKDGLEISKALSCSQIETLVYACQRHLQHLSSGARAGFFIGDSAGVGKGRTIAGLIWENWHHKRRKALWITFGSDLKFAARRDLDYVGASCIEVHALNKLPYSKLDSRSVGISEGVIVLMDSSLIASSAKGCNRLQQLVQWCGPEYDGLMIFDECHKAKNLVPGGGQPTQTGKAVLEIQAQLLQARVIYCSATGASEPCNMGYMVRLGLWGAGTSFLSFRNFLGAMKKGGVGALERVAMGMKARGMYVCHTLSYKGAEFEAVEGPLEVNLSYEEARVRDLEKIKRKTAYVEAHLRELEKIKRKGKDILKRHNSKGHDAIKIKVEDYIGLRNELLELGAQIYEICALVEKRYNRSSNSLKWNKDRVRELESKLASLEQLTELVEHYKHSSEEQSKNVRELEGTVTALETHLVRVEDDYKQKLENEALAKKEIEKLTELVEFYKESSEEWSKKVRELEGTVTALETHLVRVEDDYHQKPENEMLAKKEIEKELLLGKDVAATIERQFSSEISRLTELVEHYKDSSEERSKKVRELEGTVTALETQLVRVEDHYQQKLENEVLAKKEIEKELLLGKDVAATIERQFSSEISRLTQLVEHYTESSDEWSKKMRELEGTVTALETHSVRFEDDYKQKLENEALAKNEIEKELLLGKDVAATIERQFSSEISRLTELVELHKGSSEEWSQKARKLEEMVTVLETHLVQVEDDYKQKLENEALARKEIEKELLLGKDAAATIERQFSSEISRLMELVELYKDSSEEWSKTARDLEGTVMALEQTHLVQVEDDYKQRLEHEALARKEIEKKGKNALPRRKATWSEEEVQALIAGVEKYGTGFWKQILKDAEFASSLKNRSNVDLKDKWRNMSKNCNC